MFYCRRSRAEQSCRIFTITCRPRLEFSARNQTEILLSTIVSRSEPMRKVVELSRGRL